MNTTALAGNRGADDTYLSLLANIMQYGTRSDDRTGTGTVRIFGAQMRFDDVGTNFPLLTTKRLHWKSIVAELLWMLKGRTDLAWLHDRGVTIWDEWAKPDGTIGPAYGFQWRSWPAYDGSTIDQLSSVIESIKTNPESRRLIVSAWNPAQVSEMALPACHCFFQFAVLDGRLDTQVYIRSNDMFLGAPFNIASYALLNIIVANLTGLQPGNLIYTIGDAHIYLNHLDKVRMQMQRLPYAQPQVAIIADPSETLSLDTLDQRHIVLSNYQAHPAIKADVAV